MISSQTLASHFSLQLLGKILSMALGLVIIALISRGLGTYAFGEFTTATTFLQMFGVFVDFGLTLTLTIMISKQGADEERLVGNFLGLRLASGFVVFTLASLIALFTSWSHDLKYAIAIGAVAYFLMGGATMLMGVFQKHQSVWRASLAELINRAVLLALTVGVLFLSPNVVWFFVTSVVANAIWLICMVALAKPFVRIHPRMDWVIWKDIMLNSWPIAISIIFNLLYLKSDILFLGHYRTQEDVGLYGIAYRIIDVLTVIPTMYMGLVLPSLTHAWSVGKRDDFVRLLQQTFDLFAIMILPILVGTFFVSTDIIHLIAGNDFLSAGPILTGLIFAMIGVFFGTLFGHVVVAIQKQKLMTWGYAITATLSVIGYVIFIPRYGISGAIGMTIFSELLIACLTACVVLFHIKLIPSMRIFLKSLTCALLMGVVLSWTTSTLHIHVLFDIIFGALCYIACLLLFKAIRVQDVKSLFLTTYV